MICPPTGSNPRMKLGANTMTERATEDIWANTPAAYAPDSGLTAVDIFAGIGGFHIAAKYNGVKVTFACGNRSIRGPCYETRSWLTPHGDIRECKDEDSATRHLMASTSRASPLASWGKAGASGDSQGRGALLFEVLSIRKANASQRLS